MTEVSSITIRPYRKADLRQLHKIDHEAFDEAIAYSYPEIQHYVGSAKSLTLVAEEPDRIVGFVIGLVEPAKLGHIITIDVVPLRQRNRVGTRLLVRVEEWMWSQGVKAIYLETAVGDTGAFGFYDKHGYFILERIEGYYNGVMDAYVMMKTKRPPVTTAE
jgi:ribosomal-protein-alanine N-acetyltransferase